MLKYFREHFVKTMSFIAAKINCSKELVEFSALISQYLKNSIFLSFRIILVLHVVDFILCFKKKDLNGIESIFEQIFRTLKTSKRCNKIRKKLSEENRLYLGF